MSEAEQSMGDHQRTALATEGNPDVVMLATTIKELTRPRSQVSKPPPLTKVVSGPVADGPYHPPLYIDPLNISAAIDNYDDHAGYVSVAVDAFSLCKTGLENLSKAREQVKKDPSKTEAQQVLLLAGEAEKLQARMTQALDKARTTLLSGIEHNEKELSKPLQSAANDSISAEVRAYVRNLGDDSKRMSFLTTAFNQNDVATLSAVLGAQPFLSGISDVVKQSFTRRLHEKNQPQLAARIKVMRAALEKLEKASPPMIMEVEKCLGADWGIVAKLRKSASATEQALLLINNPVKR